jgi:hypothetical protein
MVISFHFSRLIFSDHRQITIDCIWDHPPNHKIHPNAMNQARKAWGIEGGSKTAAGFTPCRRPPLGHSVVGRGGP